MAKSANKKKLNLGGVQLGTLLALVVLCVGIAILNKNFLTYSNLMGGQSQILCKLQFGCE